MPQRLRAKHEGVVTRLSEDVRIEVILNLA